MERKDEDRLKALFGEIGREEPPADFEQALMSRVKKEVTMRSWLYMLLPPILGAAAMIGAFLLVMYYLYPELNLASLLPELDFGSFRWEYAMLPSAVALLLMADLLIRKRLGKKHGTPEKRP